MLFVVCADGQALTSHLIFPSDVDMDLLANHQPLDFCFHQTHTGWMNKTLFRSILLSTLVSDVKRRRERLQNQNSRALLIFDGHSSRMDRKLWEELGGHGIDSLCLPSNTSSLTQPLDHAPNASFKAALDQVVGMPKKSRRSAEFVDWVIQIQSAARKALSWNLISSAFKHTGIEPFNPDIILSTLPQLDPPTRTRRYLSLSSRQLNSYEMQTEWVLYDAKLDAALKNVDLTEKTDETLMEFIGELEVKCHQIRILKDKIKADKLSNRQSDEAEVIEKKKRTQSCKSLSLTELKEKKKEIDALIADRLGIELDNKRKQADLTQKMELKESKQKHSKSKRSRKKAVESESHDISSYEFEQDNHTKPRNSCRQLKKRRMKDYILESDDSDSTPLFLDRVIDCEGFTEEALMMRDGTLSDDFSNIL
ncbi:hypothetical protein BLNAU_24178 [Blattamonas nauphoetae]|nr:hypothetical protein BLNAU_24178 [Blattamonas nauphoetae]